MIIKFYYLNEITDIPQLQLKHCLNKRKKAVFVDSKKINLFQL